METQISINEYFDNLNTFLNIIPEKIKDIFWSDYEKMCQEILLGKNVLKEKEFITDWISVMYFTMKGEYTVEEKEIRDLVKQKNEELFSEEIRNKLETIDKYWVESETKPAELKYASNSHNEMIAYACIR